ncbi:protein of unknown function [Acidithiobacillus ferrivorans]|uniref:Uncharacterized protein n=1 Tax=Acidithiobacillus ferrivorans TaxID=160808 RepID=A0A060UVD3_9PROT|nr:hypothetical protein AFERRI_10129 [Acidithiobacillus ferrivorans]SMH65150.1 protein of unknown function [Acidithiobacillus ferrivorans]
MGGQCAWWEAADAPGARTVSELEVENQRLRKELAQMRMEWDIVKNRCVLCQGIA